MLWKIIDSDFYAMASIACLKFYPIRFDQVPTGEFELSKTKFENSLI